ncbi:MAG TPA: aspartate carbamoyltransferase catalytic subunit [Candidatus Aminicenantes bacterium]|nr:aspartate carbamoyltransferase catalytic subunit [Candidatus Aminicenantes bacterium]HPB54422.1 aspartate carbamoyltransferase catalytic subunit [Candidatus Aminicenantes bacterium]HPS99734.1 aspartate carbamoyltransferase catalytic subunit [Candidatus Aminicenantes bacterium]
MMFKRRHLIGIEDLKREEIDHILDTADSMLEVSTRNVKKVPALRGKTVVNLFFENSTRTRISFELAAKRLSADLLNFSGSSSSLSKGETFRDTVQNIEAMHPDIFVIRHAASGSAQYLSSFTKYSVVNAGDGAHEHPTQALLDALTIRQKKGSLDGLKVTIVGDVLHSRVARSNIFLLRNYNTRITLSGPVPLVPEEFKELGVEVEYDLDKALEGSDIVMMLRIQRERLSGIFFPSLREYRKYYQMTPERMKRADKNALLLHPGPINRGVELMKEVADGEQSVILDQVTNGVAVRMAVLYLISGGTNELDH